MKIIAGRLVVRRFLGKRHFLCQLSYEAQSEVTAAGFCCLLWLVNIHEVERFAAAEARLNEERQERENRRFVCGGGGGGQGGFAFLENACPHGSFYTVWGSVSPNLPPRS